MNYKEKYDSWLKSEYIDLQTKKELINLKDNKEIEDRFYKDLEFGTGGLRGIIGAGTNRMNIYTVGKVTKGLADYLNSKYENPSVCIAHDSRIMSREFAESAAQNLCENGIKVYLFESLRPTPMLSYSVLHLACNAGIVITASHNPKEYNGYKVYDEHGGQVTDKIASDILFHINKLPDFSKVGEKDFEEYKRENLITIIGENVDSTYYEKVKSLTIRKKLVKEKAKDLNIIYTPIHGSGNIPVRRVLKELGYENLHVVKEQESPDGKFPTVQYPNPEQPEVFKLAIDMAKELKADILFGTDPDCDRVGIVVKDDKGNFRVLTGNQTGILLTHYILSSLKEEKRLPKNGVVIKTIVTTEMVNKIAKEFNVEIMDVLTGFKYIGEKITEFQKSKEKSYLFGFEESYGYLAGTFVRDKDAVIASMLICEMALYYKQLGMNLYDALIKLYKKYGYYKEKLVSIVLKGKEGQEKISKAMELLRESELSNINKVRIVKKMDYKLGMEENLIENTKKSISLPKSNVLKFVLEDGSWFAVRPSGTEPKIKIYLSIIGDSIKDSEKKIKNFEMNIMNIINNYCDN